MTCLLILLFINSFQNAEVLNFHKDQLVYLSCAKHILGGVSQYYLNHDYKCSPLFSCINCKLLDFSCKCKVNFELFFALLWRWSIYLHMSIQLFLHLDEKSASEYLLHHSGRNLNFLVILIWVLPGKWLVSIKRKNHFFGYYFLSFTIIYPFSIIKICLCEIK